jgi:hypothetical protein
MAVKRLGASMIRALKARAVRGALVVLMYCSPLAASVLAGVGAPSGARAVQCDSVGLYYGSAYGGIGYNHSITPSAIPSPGCTGYRSLNYTFRQHSTQKISEITTLYARAWTCGSLTFTRSQQEFNWDDIWWGSGYGSSNNCGLQADHWAYWHELGVFSDSHYINYP